MRSPTYRLNALLDAARQAPRMRVCILAVDVTARGFGFVVFERTELADWGIVRVRGPDKNDRCAARLAWLLKRYSPDLLVVEDPAKRGKRRAPRIRQLLLKLRHTAETHQVFVKAIPWSAIRERWRGDVRATKYQVALVMAESLPMIRPRLPPKRKPWKSEDPRLSLFNAAALALTVLFPT